MNALIRGLADAWHSYRDKVEAAQRSQSQEPGGNDADFWAVEMLDTLSGSEPDVDLMWECLLEIWRTMDKSNEERIGMFAAGPIEDLIDCHGSQVIDRLEAMAQQEPAFKKMLLGVWPPSDEDRPDWQRLKALLQDVGSVQSFRMKK